MVFDGEKYEKYQVGVSVITLQWRNMEKSLVFGQPKVLRSKNNHRLFAVFLKYGEWTQVRDNISQKCYGNYSCDIRLKIIQNP